MKRNAFLTFCFAWVPGFGQMYQGYMKRGVSLLFWFFAVIGTGILWSRLVVQGAPFIWFLLPVIWAYSFFDTFNLRQLSPEQRAAMADFYIPSPEWITGLLHTKISTRRLAALGGWALLVIGLLGLYLMLWGSVGWWVYDTFPLLYSGMERLPGFVLAAAFILLGVRLLRKKSPPPQGGAEHDPE